MSCILNIDTSTDVCSVAVSDDGACIYHAEDFEGRNHAQKLGGYVDAALSFADSHAIPLDAVAVSSGPGSYTGLRIGVSMAKGICCGRDLKLITVPTLELLCVPVLLEHEEVADDTLLCPMLDARRMEVYTALYDRSLRTVMNVEAKIIDESSFQDVLNERPVVFFGNGAGKCKTVIRHKNARFIGDIVPLAHYMLPLADKAIAQGQVEDVAYFEPFYLKDFIAGQPKKMF